MEAGTPDAVVGRDSQRSKILSAMYSAVAGRSAVCFLEGTIGSGKSALAAEARLQAAHAGFTVLTADQLRTEAAPPLADPQAGPFCIVAEDLHCAAPETRQGLEQLLDLGGLNNGTGAPVFLLVTAAPTIDPLSRRLAKLAADTGSRITLRGLLQHELGTVLHLHGFNPTEDLLATICERSAGNPGLALQLADAGLHSDGHFAQIIADQLRPEVEQLAPCLRTFLEVLALETQNCGPQQAADIAGRALHEFGVGGTVPLRPVELVDALRPILTGNGDRVTLTDQAWRRTTVELIDPARLPTLHGLLAEVTEGIARARHRIAAAPLGDPVLGDELETQAHEALEAGQYTLSAAYMDLAVNISRAEPRSRRLVYSVLTRSVSGRIPHTLDLSDEAELVRHSPSAAAMVRAGAAFFDGDAGAARSLLHEKLRAPRERDQHDDLDRWRMLIVLCSVELAAADEQAALGAVEEARRLRITPLTRVDRVLDRVLGLYEAYALWNCGRIPEAVASLDSFLSASVGTAEHPDALFLRGRVHFYSGQTAAALEDLDRAEEERHHQIIPGAAQRGMGEQAMIEFHLGRWTDATLHAERVLSMAQATKDNRGVASSHAVLAMIATAHSDETAAALHLDWLVHEVRTSRSLPLHNVMTSLAWTARAMGRPARVLQVISAFRRTRLSTWTDSTGLLAWRALEIEALLDLDDVGPNQLRQAEALLATFTQKAAMRPGLPLVHGHPLALQAKLDVRRGDLDAGRDHYAAAIQLAAEFPHTRARLHHALGLTHRERGEHSAAHRELMAARALFTQLGAVRELSAVESRLVVFSGHDGALTPREQDIAYLVSQRRTNREIAESLFVTVKTVEYHVSNLLPKLGMSSRRELWTAPAAAPSAASAQELTPARFPAQSHGLAT